jgi:hypothetical protein
MSGTMVKLEHGIPVLFLGPDCTSVVRIFLKRVGRLAREQMP